MECGIADQWNLWSVGSPISGIYGMWDRRSVEFIYYVHGLRFRLGIDYKLDTV